jgi:hypothetical protein
MEQPKPPQFVPRNWRDFFVHLGTVAAGLVVALAFQAGAEYYHNLHRQHGLEADLRAEAGKNREMAVLDIQLYEQTIAWLLKLQSQADGGLKGMSLPERPDGLPDSARATAYRIPATAVWTTATENASLALLPRGEGEVFSRLYAQIDLLNETRLNFRETAIKQAAFETRFAHGTYPPQPDFSRITPEQAEEYSRLLADGLERARVAEARLKVFQVANEFVLSGRQSDDDLRRAFLRGSAGPDGQR